MSTAHARLIRVLVACGLAAALMPLPALADSAPAPPCWQQLLNESYSGQITTIYPHQCYTEALKRIPAVARIYGNETQQITQAMILAKQNKLPPGSGGASANSSSSHSTVWKVVHKFDPGSSDAFPTPLLVLGALAILLVIAGIAGMLWQRSHPRDSAPPTPSSDPPAPS
jgi:hypothetical protein